VSPRDHGKEKRFLMTDEPFFFVAAGNERNPVLLKIK
jgi:hypothetical protein